MLKSRIEKIERRRPKPQPGPKYDLSMLTIEELKFLESLHIEGMKPENQNRALEILAKTNYLEVHKNEH